MVKVLLRVPGFFSWLLVAFRTLISDEKSRNNLTEIFAASGTTQDFSVGVSFNMGGGWGRIHH